MLSDAVELLRFLTPDELITLFWFVFLFDIPRYFIGFVSASTLWFFRTDDQPTAFDYRVSVLIAGHNEERSFADCIRSIRRQGIADLEIICIDDGSTDRTARLLRRLRKQGLIDKAVSLRERGGKSAALNLAANLSTGEILVVVDCDCTLATGALHRLLAEFDDPAVGGVGASVLARNEASSLIASLQGLEYLFSIHLGKMLLNHFGLVDCISGALGGFRREAWRRVGGMDVGPGEDLDLTIRLRQAGYQIRFAAAAKAYTDVPETAAALFRQRMRWERDAYRIRFRKFGFILDPFDRRFRLREAVHQLDFLIFGVVGSILFPIYLARLFETAPLIAPTLLLASALILMALDSLTLLLALAATGQTRHARLLLFVPLFAVYHAALRLLRLYAYLEEMIFMTSRHDNFVPGKVRSRIYGPARHRHGRA